MRKIEHSEFSKVIFQAFYTIMSRSNEWKNNEKDSLDYLSNIDSKIWISLSIGFLFLYFILLFENFLFKINNKNIFWNTIRLFANQCMLF